MPWVLEFTEADLDRPPSEPEKMAETVRKMFDGETPVRTKDVAAKLERNYGTVKTHLHRAGRMGLLECVPRKGWLASRTQAWVR
ncbi:helix-turn-helix domain-containing protein [Roseiconus lacunae]|uniref:hypothetical protein n=1 Tax=Roseiconus lacunae TaxID=2605694 RepID=UPI001E415FEC|nr:hypothetical protein [Roseiconus lacunae]MCD0462768.1 hypothetical protein [Roseiconus lacunae]